MTITYYLLRTENAAVGDGPYFGNDGQGEVTLSATPSEAQRFATLEAAEDQAKLLHEKFGKVEIEVRNTAAS
ncbi:MAG: hypothetical protein H7315_00320 [Herminiimonas sp.]|nr:hypothetical protein [Herminiimonas sp.]